MFQFDVIISSIFAAIYIYIFRLHDNNPDEYESRYDDASKGEIAAAANTNVLSLGCLAVVSAVVLVLSMWLTVKV